jgi:hypothetical protein
MPWSLIFAHKGIFFTTCCARDLLGLCILVCSAISIMSVLRACPRAGRGEELAVRTSVAVAQLLWAGVRQCGSSAIW